MAKTESKRIVNSDRGLAAEHERLDAMYNEHKYLISDIRPGGKCSLAQNAMKFELYNHIGRQLYGGDSELARCECKLDIALPVLRESDEDFDQLCTVSVDRLNREQQLRFISKTDVTSTMSRAQNTQFISEVLDRYSLAGVVWPDYLTRLVA